ncbi:ribose 5-phosphate isomerase B [bacterium]|nr:ribose 5-phosphate isomerase B [bacterium]
MKIILGSDHAGYELKEKIRKQLLAEEKAVEDYGTTTEESCDYPDIGLKVAERVAADSETVGILICGTGIGMSITANKVPGIRAAVAYNTYVAQYAREHNDANVLVLPGRVVGKEMAMAMIRAWLGSRFAGERHQRRLDKITDIEKKYTQSKVESRDAGAAMRGQH